MEITKRTVPFLLILTIVKCACITTNTTSLTSVKPHETLSYNRFAADLFAVMVEDKTSKNIIFSPASIQTCLALAFLGAEGETAEEMRKVLHLGQDDKIFVAKTFSKFLKANFKAINLTEEEPILKIANRLYINDQLNVSEEFNKIAEEYFETQAEAVNFTDSATVVENIQQWVAQQTENKIKDIITEDAFNSDTNALLLNAIYFKAKWLNAFSQFNTFKEKFYVNLNETVEAEIMFNEEYFGYAELPELEATALEMPYKDSDISMLIILPNEIDGLKCLESKLKNIDLNDITEKMLIRKVHVFVPKFRIEVDMDLREPLEKMGLVTTFSSTANFKSLFTTQESQSISGVKHKAFLDVNEAGSEAAATTFVTLTILSGYFDEPIFRVDHPFVFAIRSKSAVFFTGHVVTV